MFERICVSDPRVRSQLRPCARRLVSADSSPLTVRGELDMTVVFPGLSCDMILVVASIGSDGLLGTEALQLCFADGTIVGGGYWQVAMSFAWTDRQQVAFDTLRHAC